MSDPLQKLSAAEKVFRIRYASANKALDALRDAIAAIPDRRLFVSAPPAAALEVANAALAFARSFVNWADGEGRSMQQVYRHHVDLFGDLLDEIDYCLSSAGLSEAAVPADGYNAQLCNLLRVAGCDFQGSLSSRFGSPPDAEAARIFLNDNWPRALKQVVEATQTHVVPRDPPGADAVYSLRRLRALLPNIVAIEAPQAV